MHRYENQSEPQMQTTPTYIIMKLFKTNDKDKKLTNDKRK